MSDMIESDIQALIRRELNFEKGHEVRSKVQQSSDLRNLYNAYLKTFYLLDLNIAEQTPLEITKDFKEQILSKAKKQQTNRLGFWLKIAAVILIIFSSGILWKINQTQDEVHLNTISFNSFLKGLNIQSTQSASAEITEQEISLNQLSSRLQKMQEQGINYIQIPITSNYLIKLDTYINRFSGQRINVNNLIELISRIDQSATPFTIQQLLKNDIKFKIGDIIS